MNKWLASICYGKGGMITKINAAKLATNSGCKTIIAKGSLNKPIENITNGGNFTSFEPWNSNSKKKWIASSLKPLGKLQLTMVQKMLCKKESLLPAGVIKVSGNFDRGDPVLIVDNEENILARDVAYSFKDTQLIVGRKSSEIEKILGYRGRNELIHKMTLQYLIVKL